MPKNNKWKYGRFNSIEKPKFKHRLELNSDNALSYSREAVRETLLRNDLDLSGEFKGIVLKKLPDTNNTLGITEDSFSFIDRIFGHGDVVPPKVRAKIRIPEIDAMVPEPESSDDSRAISLHETFEAIVSDDVPEGLKWGDVVVVSYYNASGVYQPTIKRKFNLNNEIAIDHGSTSDAVNEGRSQEGLGFVGPIGDPIGTGAPTATGQVPQSFTGPLPPDDFTPPSHINKTRVEIVPGVPYKQNRVRIHEGISRIPENSSLLVNITTRPGYRQQKMHILAANRFKSMRIAAADDGVELYAQSAWRPFGGRTKLWTNYEEYEEYLKKIYVDTNIKSLKEAKATKAYISPHESGLAIDIYAPAAVEGEYDVAPSQPDNGTYGSETNSKQKQSTAFKWLKQNAHRFGFTPLYSEAWHWECLIPINAWKTGAERTDQYDITNYNTRTIETSIANGTKTNQRNFTFE